MKKSFIEAHLQCVTLQDKKQTITMFASASGVNGLVCLCFDGVGAYIVQHIVQHQKQDVLRTFVAQVAIDKYTNLLTEKIAK